MFDANTMELGPYLWLGGKAGQDLPPLSDRVARHTKADSTGTKAERPNLRVVSKSDFTRLETIEEVVEELVGPLPQSRPPERLDLEA